MSKEITQAPKSGKVAARRIIQSSTTEVVGKAGAGRFMAMAATAAGPLALTIASMAFIDPLMAFIVAPATFLASATTVAVQSTILKSDMDSERKKAYLEHQSSVSPDTIRTVSKFSNTVDGVRLRMGAPIRHGGLKDRLSSIFSTRKAYVDASELGNGRGFVLEYTYRYMKLVKVDKIRMVDEETAWENAFNLSVTP